MLFGQVDDKVQTIEEIFGLKHLARTKSQREFNKSNEAQGVLRQKEAIGKSSSAVKLPRSSSYNLGEG